MLIDPPPTVYKCILPAQLPRSAWSAIYGSLLGQSGKETQGRPYPAWPEIADSKLPCCLPTLPAVYFLNRPVETDPKKAATRAKKYLVGQRSIKPEIWEKALAYIEYQQNHWRYLNLLKITEQPSVLFGTDFIIVQGKEVLNNQVCEAVIQASIYGNLKNFYDEIDAFGYVHEYAHTWSQVFHSTDVLDKLSIQAQQILLVLSIAEASAEQIVLLWERFWQINERIGHLVQKFKPVEEIFATYFGLRFLPVEVRRKVKPLVIEKLRERNWEGAYGSFAQACAFLGDPFWAAIFIFEPVFRILLEIGGDGAKLLNTIADIQKLIWLYIETKENDYALGYITLIDRAERASAKKINRLLKQAGIPQAVYWSVSETMRKVAFPKFDARENTLGLSSPIITLIGYVADEYIFPVILDDKKNHKYSIANPEIRLVYESLRQQLYRRCGLVCPYAYRKECCGLKKYLRRVYERIPAKEREGLKEPDCGLVR